MAATGSGAVSLLVCPAVTNAATRVCTPISYSDGAFSVDVHVSNGSCARGRHVIKLFEGCTEYGTRCRTIPGYRCRELGGGEDRQVETCNAGTFDVTWAEVA
jgi:hypothetical protein